MLVSIFFIIIGFLLLIKGADFLVSGASNIAKKINIPEIIIGLTIVSIGTSMPELIVSVNSALNGHTNLAIGSVIGSNISNLFLVLGLSTIVESISFKKETQLIEFPICIFISVIFIFICNDNLCVTKQNGMFLIILFILFLIYTIKMSFNNIDEYKIEKVKSKWTKDIIMIVIGIVSLRIGGNLTVNNAVKIGEILNLNEKTISITIISLGTSLPELFTSITAAIKGKNDLAIGNVLGSNIFNLLLIIGISAIISPISYDLNYNADMIFLLVGIVLLWIFTFLKPKNRITRKNGIILFALYVMYVTNLFI